MLVAAAAVGHERKQTVLITSKVAAASGASGAREGGEGGVCLNDRQSVATKTSSSLALVTGTTSLH